MIYKSFILLEFFAQLTLIAVCQSAPTGFALNVIFFLVGHVVLEPQISDLSMDIFVRDLLSYLVWSHVFDDAGNLFYAKKLQRIVL